ncbi:ABC transporter substrate-binding protein [Pseudofrankia inefficax]|uniref:Extracellular solute-binding protein family 1 n=1 Tax=Pseudofrankia inefficax (strain DSM 45817 / CECT 9037 / DDB 130130 / EuI1c) TaxID=298654 RepID=E3JDE4_PSEI1|nr:ABC transporter substrate-binding protein [Pseudofrankia inefficax]ADP83577.1 extracellular solute-binding protein family 1 [Pseudofrankia inefficax]
MTASRTAAHSWISARGRRRGALAASSLLVAAVVGACGGGGSDSGGTTITLTHGYTDAEATELNTLAAQWNTDHPTSKVKLSFNGGNDNALQKTVAGFTAGNYPDIAYQYGSSAAQLAKQPKLVDLTAKVTAPGVDWNDFYPSERDATTVNGKIVGIPALVDNLSLVYNKKLFDQAGVAPPTDSWTWQDFRAAAKKLTNAGNGTYGWSYVNDGSEDTVWRYLAMLWQAGGDLLTSDNSKAAFDSPAGLAALTQLRDMTVTDKSVYLDTGNQNYLNLFNSGKIAMLWTGPWDLSSITSDVSYGVTLLPGYNGNHETISGPDIYMLFDHSAPRQQAAIDFITWLTSPKVHLQFAIATGDLPLRKSETTLPEYQTYLQKYPGDKVFVENLDNVKHVRPNIPTYAQVSTAIGQMVQSVLLGQAQPQAALDAANKQVAAALAGHS